MSAADTGGRGARVVRPGAARPGPLPRTIPPLAGILPPMLHDAARPSLPGRRRIRPEALARGFVVLLACLSLVAAAADGQSVVVDRGTFLLSRNGRAIGTESFTIRRTGRGADVKIVSTGDARIEVDDRVRRITSALEATGPEMRIIAYQVKEAGGSPGEIYMTLTGRRFQATLRSPEGEELREYRASPSAVVLDQWMAHHHHFLAARAAGGATSVPVVVPRTGERLGLQIRDEGTERASIAGQMVQARHLVVEDGGEIRDVWVDEQGRILRVENRTTGFRAERRNVPG